jgi:hypothetical protein
MNQKNTEKFKKQNSGFFDKFLNEMFENLKKQQEFFNQQAKNQSRENNNSYSGGFNQRSSSNVISEKEALEILGLADSATEDEIKSKYRAMILKFHPDAGGNEYFSRKLTDARDVLLKK